MILMRPKDVCYASLFDKKDMPYIHRLSEEIQVTHNQDLVNDFNNNCQRKWNDHSSKLEIGNKKIEFRQVSKADDLVVNAGVDQCIDQILGTSTTRWTIMSVSNVTTAVTAADTSFPSATASVTMTTPGLGWTEFAGSTLRYAGVFGETLTAMTITTAGVVTSGGILLNRNVFSNFPLVHTFGSTGTGFVISCVIEFVPVM